jgi:hypothetical protein
MWSGLVALALAMNPGSIGYTQLTGITTGNMVLQLDSEHATRRLRRSTRLPPRVAAP